MDRIENALGGKRCTGSFDTEGLIAELERDVAELGPDDDCWLIYRPVDDYVCFTDYQLVVSETSLSRKELDLGERAIIATLGEALEWRRRQDSIL